MKIKFVTFGGQIFSNQIRLCVYFLSKQVRRYAKLLVTQSRTFLASFSPKKWLDIKRFYTRYSNNQFLTVLSLLYDSVQIEITEKLSLRIWLRLVSYFCFGHGRMRARASGEAARNEGWLIYFSPYIDDLVLVFLLSSVLFHNHQILMASLAFFLKHFTLSPTTLEMGKINNWTYFYRKCSAENAGDGISETLN